MAEFRIRVKRADGEECLHSLDEPCPRCQEEDQRPPATPRIHTFREGWYENIGPDPEYITSPQQLRDRAAAHGQSSQYLLGSSTWRTKSNRWW